MCEIRTKPDNPEELEDVGECEELEFSATVKTSKTLKSLMILKNLVNLSIQVEGSGYLKDLKRLDDLRQQRKEVG